MFAVRRKLGTGAAVHGVGARRGFRQGIRADDLASRDSWQILLLLLFGAEINNWQQADAAVRAPGRAETGVLGDAVGDHCGGDLVHLEAAVGFGNFDAAQAQFARFFQQIARDGKVLVFDFFGLGKNFLDRELFGRLADHLMLLGEVFGSEDLGRLALFEQESAAQNLGFR